MTTIEIPIRRGRRGARVVMDAAESMAGTTRPPVVARTLALAHTMQTMIERGEVTDQADLARVFGFTRARISQIMDLALLAPDIQDDILRAVELGGRDAVTERELRRVVRATSWSEQRRAWRGPRASEGDQISSGVRQRSKCLTASVEPTSSRARPSRASSSTRAVGSSPATARPMSPRNASR